MKKKLYNLEEIQAMRICYGKPIKKSEIARTLGFSFLVVFVYVFSLFYSAILAGIIGILAAFYTYFYMFPQNEKRDYEKKSFDERNRFVNNITQLLTNSAKTPMVCMREATDRANGELKKDLITLQTKIFAANKEEIKTGYNVLIEKYKSDVIFGMFLEQMITTTIEGRTNLDTIKDIKTYHNEIKKKQGKFLKIKQKEIYNYKFISIIGFVLILAITFSFGVGKFINTYAKTPIGLICNGIYLGLLGFFFLKFRKNLIDDNVLEVKV